MVMAPNFESYLAILAENADMSQQTDGRSSLPSDLSELQNKGALFILMALGTADGGLTFTQIRDRTNLSNGTTQRRLEGLEASGWIRKEAEFNDSGNPVAMYYLSNETMGMWDALKDLGSTLFNR